MGERGRRGVAWGLCAAALVLLAATVGLALAGWSAPVPVGFPPWSSQLVGAVALAGAPVLGAVLAGNGRSLRYGWWWCGLGAGFGLSGFAEAYITYAVSHGHLDGSVELAATVGDVGWVLALMCVPFLLLRFPDGRLPSQRWRVLAWVLHGAAGAAVAGVLLAPGQAGIAPVDRMALTAEVAQVGMVLLVGGVVVLFLGTAPAIASLVVRYRAAGMARRQQIKWVLYAAALNGASLAVLTWWTAPGLWDPVLESLPLVALYVAVGIAVLRYGLYDIDRLISRTLVYGVLTAGVVALYVGLVGVLSALFQTRATLPVALVATAVVAVVFQPLRERAQRAVNRLLYGERDNPLAVISRLAGTLEAAIPTEAVLPTVVATTAQALRLPHASIWEYDGGSLDLAAAEGAAPGSVHVEGDPALARVLRGGGPIEVARLDPRSRLAAALVGTGATLAYPLQHRGRAVGLLCLAPRSPGEGWSRADLSTLADLARHAGAAAHATLLAGELQRSLGELRRSRELLVASQEQERRRIQRDLHDGLGPILAAVRLHLEACLQTSADLPPHLRGSLERVDDLVGRSASEVRRLVTGLHPPALAQLGLVPALRAHVEQFGRDLNIRACLSGDDAVHASPAVEVAVFRVAQEALTNVAKHAHATAVDVHLSLHEGRLQLTVRDDGTGLPVDTNGHGTGMAGMRERAALLGGQLTVGAAAGGGTQVTMDLPVVEAVAR